jgi:peptide/nickel transport system permease protein
VAHESHPAPAVAPPAGRGPWRLALGRLRRNPVPLAFLGIFALIVLFVLAAPLWGNDVAHTGPNATHTLEKVEVDGEKREVVNRTGTPIGPLWFGAGGRFFLGADGRLGRDEMVRLMYGGRTSLFIGLTSALITTILATVLGLLAGYYRGWTDTVIARALDVIWAFPVLLLAICVATVLLNAPNGVGVGPINIQASSLWLPTLIIAFIYLPYVYRPVRGHVLSVSEKEYVEAAIAQGASGRRLIFSEVLPNVITVVIVLLPLMIATTILTEATLSYLSIGVQPPNASWGTVISDGQQLLYTRPWVAIAPGIMIVVTVLALNMFGDGVRDALDPRAKLRIEG